MVLEGKDTKKTQFLKELKIYCESDQEKSYKSRKIECFRLTSEYCP